MCIKKHTGRRDIGASQKEGDRPALRAAAPTQRGLSSLQPSARTSQREGLPSCSDEHEVIETGRLGIAKEFHIETKRNKRKIEQENKGRVLDKFRESQDKCCSHLVEPLG